MSDPNSYTVGWICAISTEHVAARQFLDEEHDQPEHVSQNDNNTYTLGRMGRHKVVIAGLPDAEYGIASAAAVARDMLHSFPNVRIGLMVGIGGGAPSGKHDIRLGDIVVSSPGGGHGGVYQYDFGKTIQSQKFCQTGVLNQPPTLIRTAVSDIRARHEADGNQIEDKIDAVLSRKPRLKNKYRRPDGTIDRLYKADFVHVSGDGACEECCGVDMANMVQRRARNDEDDNPAIHYGLIASANQVMKDATIRDALIEEKQVLCFEMEAAGLMNQFPCLVIRGICDYADSHKNKRWQGYAAMAAAAYAKDILTRIAPNRVEHERKISEALASMKEELSRVHTIATIMSATTSNLKTDFRSQQIHSWLSPADPSTNYNDAISQRQEGTGQWFIKGEVFTSFKEGKVPFLWLNGIPGCGKTVLSSSIIEDLRQSPSYIPPIILYFYFDFNDNRKQTSDSAIRSLLWQMAKYSSTSSRELKRLYGSCGDGRDQPSIQSLVQTLDRALQKSNCVRIVLDALDECTTRSALLPWLTQLAGKETNSVQIIVTSRKEHEIEIELEKWLKEDAVIPLQQLDVDADIGAYVYTMIRTDQKFQRWQDWPKVQDEIGAELRKKANGMFRWAKCQLDELATCLDYPQLSKALTSLPPSLEETYTRILDKIPERHREQSIRILQVVTWSERPLRIEEAVDFLAVDLDNEPGFDARNRMPLPREIASLCSSLVRIVEVTRDGARDFSRSGDSVPELQTTQELQLSHFSVKEYFMSNLLKPRLFQNLGQTPAVTCVATVFLKYLLHLELETSPEEIRSRFPLSAYAAQHWTTFTRLAGTGCERLQKLTMRFFSHRKAYLNWRRLYDPDQPWQEEPEITSHLPNPLYYSSREGLEDATKALLETGAEVNAPGGAYGNALQAACAEGHEKIVAILLAKGADITVLFEEDRGLGPIRYRSVLHAASANGHGSIVRRLLDHDSKVDTMRIHYGDALQQASSRGYDQIVQFLMEKGADVESKDLYGRTSLHLAAGNAHRAVINCLLGWHANIAATDDEGETPLFCAALGGHETTVELLLGAGSPVDDRAFSASTALQGASSNGHTRIVEQLIKAGANVAAHSGSGWTALHAASNFGHTTVVSLLLQKEPNLEAKYSELYGDGRTALHMASGNGHTAVCRLLLDAGAETETRDGRGKTALQIATGQNDEETKQLLLARGADARATTEDDKASPDKTIADSPVKLEGNIAAYHEAVDAGHTKIVQQLLDNGVDLEARDEHGVTALCRAAQQGHVEVLQLLLSKNADIEATTFYGGTALCFAACSGHEMVEQILLEKGANANASTAYGDTVLEMAASSGHEATVRQLLAKGVSVSQTQRGTTALIKAARNGHVAVTKLLLDEGADIGAKDLQGGTSLHCAAEYGHKQVVNLLLQQGTSVRAKDYNGGTALHKAAEGGHYAVAQILVDHEVDLDAMQLSARGSSSNMTALQLASMNGFGNVVELLIQRGADIEKKNKTQGGTALCYAASGGHTTVAQLLLDHGANIEAGSEEDGTALQQAARNGHAAMVRFLLAKKANVNAGSTWKGTALREAAANGHPEVVRLLIEEGADIEVSTKYGGTALIGASNGGHAQVVRILLEQAANVEASTDIGCTALHQAAAAGYQEIVRLLIEEKANVEAETDKGEKAIDWAAACGKDAVVRLLANARAGQTNSQTQRTSDM